MAPPIAERPGKEGTVPPPFTGELTLPVIELSGAQFDHSNPTKGSAGPPGSRGGLVSSTNTNKSDRTKQDKHIKKQDKVG